MNEILRAVQVFRDVCENQHNILIWILHSLNVTDFPHCFYLFHLDQNQSSLVNQSVSSSFEFAVIILLMQLTSVIHVYFIHITLLEVY